jgi:hypothetical protein
MILVRGAPAPVEKNEPTKGGGSMKDIEVIDDINLMEERLKTIPNINPPISVVEIMKMIKVPESLVEQIKTLLPDIAEDRVDEFLNTSFWEAIHPAGQYDSLSWYFVYGKSLQDSIINIFYYGITIEMKGTFINFDFSKSLIYLQIPIMGDEEIERSLNSINRVTDDYPAGKSTADVVLVESERIDIRNVIVILKSMFLLIVLIMGIISFVLFYQETRRENNGVKQEPQEVRLERGYPPPR